MKLRGHITTGWHSRPLLYPRLRIGSMIWVLERKIENRNLTLSVRPDSAKRRWRLDPAPTSHSPLLWVTQVVGSSLQLDSKYILWKSCQNHRRVRSPAFLQGILCFLLFSRESSWTSDILVCREAVCPASRKQIQRAVTAPSHDTARRAWKPSSFAQELFWDGTNLPLYVTQISPGGFTSIFQCNVVLLLLS